MLIIGSIEGAQHVLEVYLKQQYTGFTIQILNDELDGGDVIKKR